MHHRQARRHPQGSLHHLGLNARGAILRDSFEGRLEEMSRGLGLLLGPLVATKIALSLLVVSLGACAGLKSQALLQDLLNEGGVE